ncbi:protein of unknown function [Nitrosomonas cryotolerans]|uniref:Transmembrane protein n=1 Tax=Nitrosomonas cryotolerans ATCC 49181 TaxID=1131553 RepID=A0A1N6IM22_9PROT|nr:DUF4845 domain-containing protein [Nitrosomonas cryotolerans]SFP36820.1 protein of unknown function [Nitrosomonas cryotolerans]SIO33046.1 protein of unknown function [Nitrosomonas cryotolerans ATCC 49181]
MLYRSIEKQKGVSLPRLLVWSGILVFISILGMKLIPAYIEYASIKKTLTSITNDSNLQNATVNEIRQSFNKRAQIDNINVINGRDIKISQKDGRRILTVNYFVKIPLAANISLYLDFDTANSSGY